MIFCNKKLILFDLDGVIIDSKANMEAAWLAVCKETAIDIPFENYFSYIGRAFPDIMRCLGVIGDNAKKAETIFRTSSMENITLIKFFPDAADILARLQRAGLKLGIVTSKDKLRTNAILAMLPVEFITVQTPNDRYRPKPAPDHLLAAMALTRTDPSDSLYVGDMMADYDSACRAGIDYLHAEWGYGQKPSSKSSSLAKFSLLPGSLKI